MKITVVSICVNQVFFIVFTILDFKEISLLTQKATKISDFFYFLLK